MCCSLRAGTQSLIVGIRAVCSFRYFFPAVFFLRESDAPGGAAGGFGTLDDCSNPHADPDRPQPPIPLVLLVSEGDPFWDGWQQALALNVIIQTVA